MHKHKKIEFQGQEYFDNRLFVLYLCPGKIRIEEGDDGAVWTTIYHEKSPEDNVWCVVTYKNCNRYPLYRIDSFYKKEDAESYIRKIEPETPLISLGGRSSGLLMSYDEYVKWKKKNDMKDYDWNSLYLDGGTNAQETVGQDKNQFKGIK
ncbi:hypothetical protein HOC76_00590 [bacterium]|jgi:hypothetical protein|nr:hypothetical protein [bacterium]MBT6756570.1 hypothetical protein [Candidatus Paceibacterota bacterium]MBT7706594.1 hypothetical protein [archaeon]